MPRAGETHITGSQGPGRQKLRVPKKQGRGDNWLPVVYWRRRQANNTFYYADMLGRVDNLRSIHKNEESCCFSGCTIKSQEPCCFSGC